MERDLITTRALLPTLFAAGLVSTLARTQTQLVLSAAIDLVPLIVNNALRLTTFDGTGLFVIVAIFINACLKT